MRKIVHLSVEGLGIVVFSPFAVEGIAEGENYLESSLWEPDDVARNVNSCRLATFCTGSPGQFILDLATGAPTEEGLARADFKVRLGLKVRDGEVHVRDLYDFMEWSPHTEAQSKISLDDGYYRITAYTSLPPSGVLGDDQVVYLRFERVDECPEIHHSGVPMLCPEDD